MPYPNSVEIGPRLQAGFRLINEQILIDLCNGRGSFTNLSVLGLIASGSADSLTAFATGGQTNATPITTAQARVTTVTTAGDSVKLPASVAGAAVTVENASANSMQVFGAGTDTVAGVATAATLQNLATGTFS